MDENLVQWSSLTKELHYLLFNHVLNGNSGLTPDQFMCLSAQNVEILCLDMTCHVIQGKVKDTSLDMD